MFMAQKWPFFQRFFFLALLGRKMSFTSKNRYFSKGVNLWFQSKNDHFSNFSGSHNIGQENVFYDFPERKNAFLRYKDKKFKKTKNLHFSKRVNRWFCSKNGHFSIFSFRQYRPGKCLLRYSRRKKPPF